MRMTVVTLLALWLVGCGGGAAESPAATAAGGSAAVGEAPRDVGDQRGTAALEGLPAEAVSLPNEQGRQLWGLKRPDGRAVVYEVMANGLLSGAAGRLEDLPSIYPGVDFGPLKEE